MARTELFIGKKYDTWEEVVDSYGSYQDQKKFNRAWKTVRQRLSQQGSELPLYEDPQFVFPTAIIITAGSFALGGYAGRSFTFGNDLCDYVPSRLARFGIWLSSIASIGGAGYWMYATCDKLVVVKQMHLSWNHWDLKFAELEPWEADALKGEPLAAILHRDLYYLIRTFADWTAEHVKAFIDKHSVRVFEFLPEELVARFRIELASGLKEGVVSLEQLDETDRTLCVELGVTDDDIAQKIVADVGSLSMALFSHRYGNRWRNMADAHVDGVRCAMKERLNSGWGEEIANSAWSDDYLRYLDLTQEYHDYLANNTT